MFSNPTIDDFKTYFVRDFVYGIDNTTVMDSDIGKAFGQTDINMNPALFGTQANFTLGYLFLAAHYLCMDLRMSSQGVAGQFSWLQTGKSVGNVSESLAIPPRVLENPMYAYFSKTNYGAKYLQMIWPKLSGQVFTVHGRTHA